MKRGKIIVTGGAGFIGSALVWALNEKGADNIILVDRLGSDEKWKNLTPLRFGDYFEADDLFDVLEQREDYFGEVSTVFHLGACSATTEKDVAFLMRNNFEYTKCLADWTLRRRARFVYASSAATYGDGSAGMDDQAPDLHRFRPLNPYGYSKHLFDVHAQKIGKLKGMVGLKYFNVYGPNEDHKDDMRSLVNKAYDQIVETGKVKLFKSYHPDYADGEQMRDFLYVKDAVEMTIHLANSPLAGGLFNVGSGNASTWVQLATAIFAALGRQPEIEFIEMPEALKGKYQYYTCADITKLRKAKYEAAVTPLESAVSDYVKNYLVPGKKLGE
ncbi:MAG: ADP-glyceromanno-heptose 6-epimerase [Verrucomicrobiota bacterium]